MKTRFKKLIFRLLCNNITGSIIFFFSGGKIPDLRWSGFRFVVPRSSVNKQMAASVFWGFYESAEIRFVEKYLLNDIDVIELGSSIGIVSAHIASKIGNGMHFITVEANPFLIETIRLNIEKHKNQGATFEILNNAVGHGADEVTISITSNNTETRVIENAAQVEGVKVKTIKFSELIKRNNREKYSLVCDIEGSEVEILLNEQDALQHCRQLFIELHDTTYNNKHYSIEMLKDILVNTHGFQIKEQHGPVVYCGR